MCGRFNILSDAEALMDTFEILQGNVELQTFEPGYNVSPSVRNTRIDSIHTARVTRIPIVRLGEDGRRVLQEAVWPLVPVWASGQIPKYATANARAETMTTLASYRNAWKKSQRCLIAATGFYEWQRVEYQKNKQPWHIYHLEQPVMGFAGLWEVGYTTEGEPFESCAIVTTSANQLMAEIHNSNQRMPVIIDPAKRDTWLGTDSEAALELAVSYRDGLLSADPISSRINNPGYNRPDCLEPIDIST